MIKKILRTFYLTATLEEHELEKVAGAMKLEEFKTNDMIIKYGDSGRIFYILTSGTVDVAIYEDDAKPDDPDIEEKRKLTKPL
jgi:signal-transduction protein with cAMP-binding, CBS, and nucleotidyltransferase domain